MTSFSPSVPRSRRGVALAAGLAAALVLLNGCGDSADPAAVSTPSTVPSSEPTGSRDEAPGTLAFELRTNGDVTIDAFDYTITRPGFTKAGTIDVASSNTFSAKIDALPAGSGYAITVLGSSVGSPVAQCSGSASFEILPRTVSNVPIDIRCRLERDPPPTAEAVPVPRPSTWLLGLALLTVGAAFAQRSVGRRS